MKRQIILISLALIVCFTASCTRTIKVSEAQSKTEVKQEQSNKIDLKLQEINVKDTISAKEINIICLFIQTPPFIIRSL